MADTDGKRLAQALRAGGQLSAEQVALANQAAGREGVGAQVMAGMRDDEIAAMQQPREVDARRRILMQSPKDSTRWEALEYAEADPTQHYRSELDTAGAAHYQQDGGFEIVPAESFNAELAALSERLRAARGEGAPTEMDALRQQVIERSGAGAPGMVYVEDEVGEPLVLPLEAAEQRGLRVISAEEARALGEASQGSMPPAKPAASAPAVDPRVLAQALRGAR